MDGSTICLPRFLFFSPLAIPMIRVRDLGSVFPPVAATDGDKHGVRDRDQFQQNAQKPRRIRITSGTNSSFPIGQNKKGRKEKEKGQREA
jgi:hypothetical protein